MAVNYAFPPHIANVPNPGEQFARGLTLGVGIQQQREQLAAQQAAAAMQAAVHQRQIEQEAIRDQQKLMVEQAYQESTINLRKQQLDQEAQKIAIETQDAARRFAAQQLYQKRVTAGEDPAKVLLELGPSLGESLTGAAQLYRASHPVEVGAPEEVTFGGQPFLKIPQASGAARFQQIKQPATAPEGPLEAREVVLNGQTIPGVFASPGSSGGLLPHNIPGDRYQNLRNQLELMEKSQMGRYLVSGRPPTDKTKVKDYEKAKAKYDKILAEMEKSLEQSPVTAIQPRAPTTAPGASTRRIRVRTKDGKTGTIPESQRKQAIDAGWEIIEE